MSNIAPRDHLPTIAIGASAGGLEAYRALFKDMPGDTPAAFILVQHLDPTHDSMMVDLLAGKTGLEVVQAADGMALRKGVLHVIPPGYFLTVSHGLLNLTEPDDGKSVRMPFDVLLRSLAKDAGAQSGCVVLSGTGTDGTLGLADIHAAGGLVLAQDPKEASYSGMPDSAIATGLVDETLPVSGMIAAIEKFAAQLLATTASDSADHTQELSPSEQTPDPALFDDLLSFISTTTEQDLSLYKRGTLERRIARRMALVGLGTKDVERYFELLKTDKDELSRLSADLLIHVTGFFRDPEVFEYLSAEAIPDLLADLPPDRPLRIWVAGCSTGEEAYSLAISCVEAMEAAGSSARLQILASDVDPDAIATARAGFYPKDIAATVSCDRLERFFVSDDGGWRVTSVLRDLIVFTVADLLSDPPFSKIDLVSCRNVLIYLGPEAQERVIARCCFALRPKGLLLLGAAEMPGQSDSCFAVANKKARLWQRVGKSNPADLRFATGKRGTPPPTPDDTPNRNSLAELCRSIVLENYAPAAVLLNTQLECLYFLGPTENYLKISQGHPETGIIRMLPKALKVRFRAAAASCGPANPLVTIPVRNIVDDLNFNIALHSVSAGTEQLLLACFIDIPHTLPDTAGTKPTSGEERHASDLEADLEATRSDLSEALRDLEREVEAHGADAAEALSVNEEFQSTNEELLASKEELQSLNEELTALNSQLQETLERHRTTANDLQNVLYSTDVATLFLDLDLNIRFFTPTARKVFHLIPSDVGRPLSDLASVAKGNDPTEDARDVLKSNNPIERECAGADDKWYLRRVQPYRAEGGQIEGVVITYVDITERKRTHAALEAAMAEADRATRAKSRFLAAASHDLRQPLQSMALLHKLLSRQKRSNESSRLATLMDQTLNAMTGMLDSMLDVNRIDSGIVRPNMQPVAIGPIMQRMMDDFGPQCALRGLKLRCVPSTAWVQTDPQLIEQILRNLLSNAQKYTQKGGILLGCRRRGQDLILVVCDSGIGVADTETKAIFDAYHRGEQATAISEHGLGLGLSIVQRLTKLMDHPITVRSSPGKGSAFMITLRRVDEAAEAPQPEPTIPEPPDATLQTGTILLVEDEEPLRDLLADVLKKEGHKVVSKANAKAALAWASGDVAPPDLMLTDFDLHGGSSGLTLAQDLPDVLGEAVPTIILTGDITSATLKKIAGSPHEQMVKPVLPEILLAKISDLLLSSREVKVKMGKDSDSSVFTMHVIDDDPMIRESMRRLFEAEGWMVATYASAEDFLAAPRPGEDACLLVDNLLPGMDGVALIKLLQEQQSPVPAIVLTGHGDAAVAVAAMKAGASDLIEKPISAADLLASVRQAILPAKDSRAQAKQLKDAQRRFSDLTPRERDVLLQVLAGEPNKIIAFNLGINQRTVENHRASVMRKTGVDSLPALVRLAIGADLQGL